MILWNQALPFWDRLTELQQMELLDMTVVREYASGEAIRLAPGLFMVNDGQIAEKAAAAKGADAFVASFLSTFLLTPDQFLDPGTAPMKLFAQEESEICYVNYADWMRFSLDVPQADLLSDNLRVRTQTPSAQRGVAFDPNEPY